jgi:ribosomal protein L27
LGVKEFGSEQVLAGNIVRRRGQTIGRLRGLRAVASPDVEGVTLILAGLL